MTTTLLRRLALWLLRNLEAHLDSDLRARVATYQRRKEVLESEQAKALREINEAELRLNQITALRDDVQRRLAEREMALSQLQDDLRRIDSEIHSQSNTSRVPDRDVLRVDL